MKTFYFRNSKGFTLVEILITAAIIGLIVAIVISGLNLVRSKGRDARRIADIKQLNGAIENYFDSCYEFPEELNDLVNPSNCSGNVFINELPTDPQPGKSYNYFVTASGAKSFHLCATLELSYGNNKGKSGAEPIAEEDSCDGTDEFVFDALGGALGR